jgi:hypothetical protein
LKVASSNLAFATKSKKIIKIWKIMLNQTYQSSIAGSLIMLAIVGLFIFVLTRPKKS